MAEQLKNTLSFTALAPTASVVLPHGLQTAGGLGLSPDIVFIPTSTLGVVVTSTSVTLTNNGDAAISGVVLVEYWHTIERAFGGAQNTILSTNPFIVVTGEGSIASSTPFEPDRVLFVAQSWPAGSDPTVFFTTIAAANAQAATMTPVSGNPVSIAIAPGTYTENVTLQSWVFLAALCPSFAGVTINGTMTWTPVAGIAEAINVYNLIVVDAVTITTTGKSGGKTSSLFNNCEVGGTFTGRASSGATQDFINFENCTAQPTAWTFSSCAVEWLGGRVDPFTFNGACTFAISGVTTVPAAGGTWAVNGTSTGKFTGSDLLALGVAAAAGTAVAITGCYDAGALSGAGAFDVRGQNYDGNANLAGITGTCKRTTYTFSVGPTLAPGAGGPTNSVVFAVPYPDGNYNVALQLTAGTGSVAATVTAKTGTQFTLTDAVGGNTYDATVAYD